MLTVRSQKELIKQKVGISYKILVRSDLAVSCDQIVGSNPGHETIDFCTSSKNYGNTKITVKEVKKDKYS